MKTFLIAMLTASTLLTPAFAETYPSSQNSPLLDRIRALMVEPDHDPVLALARCCKVCSKGKACGDSCIARNKTCHVGPGCACDG